MRQYKAQFISMILMITIGVGIFVGFNMEWVSIDTNTKRFFKDSNFADYRIVSEEGFSKADVEKTERIRYRATFPCRQMLRNATATL